MNAPSFPDISDQSVDISLSSAVLRGRWLKPSSQAEDRPTLVFLHEGLGCIASWRDFPAHIARCSGLTAFLYDRQGHGQSVPLRLPRRGDYLHREAFEILPRVLAAAGVERSILIGHSDGGTIALLFAARFPEQVAGIITEAAHVFVEAETLAGIRRAVALYEKSDLPARLARYHGSQTEALFRAWSDTWLREDFRTWTVEAYLPEIRAPLLAIQGEDDEYGTPEQLHRIAAGVAGPVQPLLLPDCGHTPHREQEERAREEMCRFIHTINNL